MDTALTPILGPVLRIYIYECYLKKLTLLNKKCYMILEHFSNGLLIKLSQLSFNFLPPEASVFCNCIMLMHKF